MDLTANVLLAAGASPAMVDTPSESEEFARIANGVLINIGTPRAETYAGMEAAIAGATASGTPWVLDPVACGALGERSRFASRIARRHPAVIRGNASEVAALAGASGVGRGTDATTEVNVSAAQRLAEETGAVVAVSGQRDLIISPDGQATWVASGHPLLQRVTGTGCALGAMVAAYAALTADCHSAALAAHAHLGAAATRAAERDRGPGSFRVAWVDAINELDAAAVSDSVQIEEVR